jgi:hypothetical protein
MSSPATRVVGCVALACITGCGAADAGRGVESKHSAVQASLPAVTSAETKATLVLTFPSFSDPRRALLVVDASAKTFLGEVVPFSYAVTTVEPGKVHLLVGAPEANGVCASIEGEVKAGKVYAVAVSNFLAYAGIAAQPLEKAPDVEAMQHALSLFSALSLATDSGNAAVKAQWEDYWQPCIEPAREARAQVARSSLGLIEEFKRAAEIRPAYGVDALYIKAPP